jgi:hypothetical protein
MGTEGRVEWDQNCLDFLPNKLGKGSLKVIRSMGVKTHQRERGFGLGGPARVEEGTPAGAVELCTRVMRLPTQSTRGHTECSDGCVAATRTNVGRGGWL